MLSNPIKFGDDRTPEQKEADRIAENTEFEREIAELKAKYPERFEVIPYADFVYYLEDIDILEQE